MNCEFLPKCPFFDDKMADMPAIATMMKKKYCLEDPNSCARYMVRMASPPKPVPADLFPMDVERARSILVA
jgi:hypothetical protein